MKFTVHERGGQLTSSVDQPAVAFNADHVDDHGHEYEELYGTATSSTSVVVVPSAPATVTATTTMNASAAVGWTGVSGAQS